MARAATGQVVERSGARGITYALRFRAYGNREYVTLGNTADGWTRRKAEEELANVLADVRRGQWQADRPEPVKPPEHVGRRSTSSRASGSLTIASKSTTAQRRTTNGR